MPEKTPDEIPFVEDPMGVGVVAHEDDKEIEDDDGFEEVGD